MEKSISSLFALGNSHSKVVLTDAWIGFLNFKDKDYAIWNNILSVEKYQDLNKEKSNIELKIELRDEDFFDKYKNYDFIIIKNANEFYYMNINKSNPLSFKLKASDVNASLYMDCKINSFFYYCENQKLKERMFYNGSIISLNCEQFNLKSGETKNLEDCVQLSDSDLSWNFSK